MYNIRTKNESRRQFWIRIFGRETLPVKVAKPRIQPFPGSWSLCLAFDLDADRLHPGQRARFASYLARNAGLPYETALIMVDGYPIRAHDCIIEEEAAEETAVSSFLVGLSPGPVCFSRYQETAPALTAGVSFCWGS